MSYSPRIIGLLGLTLFFPAVLKAIDTLNEFNPQGLQKRIELKVRGFLSGELFVHMYNNQGQVLDTLGIHTDAMLIPGEDEYHQNVDYYLFHQIENMPLSGGIAISFGPNYNVVEFVSYNCLLPLMAVDGPAAEMESRLIPKSSANTMPHTSFQKFRDAWYIGPSTFGEINHIGCMNADTTYIDTTLCQGEVFDCGNFGLIYPGECSWTYVGSDDCDSTVIYLVDFIPGTPINMNCADPSCLLSGVLKSAATISVSGNYQVNQQTNLTLDVGIAANLASGFSVSSGAQLNIDINTCAH